MDYVLDDVILQEGAAVVDQLAEADRAPRFGSFTWTNIEPFGPKIESAGDPPSLNINENDDGKWHFWRADTEVDIIEDRIHRLYTEDEPAEYFREAYIEEDEPVEFFRDAYIEDDDKPVDLFTAKPYIEEEEDAPADYFQEDYMMEEDEPAEYFREAYIEEDDVAEYFGQACIDGDQPAEYFREPYIEEDISQMPHPVEDYSEPSDLALTPPPTMDTSLMTGVRPISLLTEPFYPMERVVPEPCPYGPLCGLLIPQVCLGCCGQHVGAAAEMPCFEFAPQINLPDVNPFTIW